MIPSSLGYRKWSEYPDRIYPGDPWWIDRIGRAISWVADLVHWFGEVIEYHILHRYTD